MSAWLRAARATTWFRATRNCTLDVRLPDVECVEDIVGRVYDRKSYDPDVRITIEGAVERPPFERLPHGAKLFEHIRALGGELGLAFGEQSVGGASDGNFTAPIVPTIDGMGVGGAGRAHTLDEYLEISSLVPRCALLYRAYETLL